MRILFGSCGVVTTVIVEGGVGGSSPGYVMTWFQVDDCFPDHRKVRLLGDDRLLAVGLWTLCGSWCGQNLTDGFVPVEVVDRWDPGLKVAARLVEVKLWRESSLGGESGYRFHDWGEYQLTREEVLKRRADARERMRRYRERRDMEVSEAFSSDVSDCYNEESDTSLLKYLNTSEETRHSLEETRNSTNGQHKPTGQTSRNASRFSLEKESSDAAPSLPYLTTKNSPSRTAKKILETTEESSFEEFWKVYPRRQQKQDARKAWTQQRRKGATPQQIITGAKGYAEYTQGTDQRYIKLPASWLRAGGHEDHQPVQPPPPDHREPAEILRAFWKTGDAPAVAKILHIPFVDKGQPPSDKTPPDKWRQTTRQAWITDHFEAAVDALKKSRENT